MSDVDNSPALIRLKNPAIAISFGARSQQENNLNWKLQEAVSFFIVAFQVLYLLVDYC
jgi:hypothetical protein